MRSVAILALILLLPLLLFAQDHPTIQAQPNTVYVAADGKFEANPDTAVLQFNIAAQEDNSRAAYERASRQAEQVRQILRNNGIDPKAAEISSFSIQPVYDYRSPKHKLVGYTVNASASLKLKDFSKIPAITQQLSETDITGAQSLSYTLEDMDAAKGKAVEDAYRRARESAAVLAHAAGRTLGDLSYGSVDTYENVRVAPVMRGMATSAEMLGPAPPPPPTQEFSPENITVTAHVNALFTLK